MYAGKPQMHHTSAHFKAWLSYVLDDRRNASSPFACEFGFELAFRSLIPLELIDGDSRTHSASCRADRGPETQR
jgi:hypothetical protein